MKIPVSLNLIQLLNNDLFIYILIALSLKCQANRRHFHIRNKYLGFKKTEILEESGNKQWTEVILLANYYH